MAREYPTRMRVSWLPGPTGQITVSLSRLVGSGSPGW